MKYLLILGGSFILEGILSVLIPIFTPLFTLTGLLYLILFSKFKDTDIIRIGALTGFLYDIIYMHMLMINMLLFIMLAYFLMRLQHNYSLKQALIIIIISLSSYLLGLYLFILINSNISFDILAFLKSIYKVLVINLLYFGLLAIIFNRSKERKIRIYSYR